MAIISIPFTFSAGAVIIASQHNSDFSTIYNDYNGNIDNTNIVASAGISYSKLTLTGAVLNTDLAGSIADSKLSQITTASKVSGAAITLLSSLPAGAGVIPSANLPAAPASGITFISNTPVATAATTGNITIVSTNFYIVKATFTAISATDTYVLRFNADNGSHYSSIVRGFIMDSTPTVENAVSSGGTSITLNVNESNDSNLSTVIEIRIYPQEPSNGSMFVKGEALGTAFIASDKKVTNDFSGTWANSAAATSFSILTSGGATFSGNVYLYKYPLS